MKLFLKIFGGIVALIIILVIALNLYMTDDRLRDIIMPRLSEMTGREIQVEQVSYTFWRTFPSFGLVMQNLDVPDTDSQNQGGRTVEKERQQPLLSLEEMILSVDLFPLLSGNVNVTQLDFNKPFFNYIIFADGRTNLDSLLEQLQSDDDPTAEETTTQIDLEMIRVSDGRVRYHDRSTETMVTMNGLNASLSLQYGELLETDLESSVDGMTVRYEGDLLINNLPVSLSQKSTLDMEAERLLISEGVLNIRGLDLDVRGEIAEWSQPEMWLDLVFNSSSDDFAALLEMVPDEYKEDLQGVETRGSLILNASVTGRIGEETIPDFEAVIGVENGYMKYPDVDRPIEDIQISMLAGNELVTIERFSARADGNTLTATGKINRPLEDDATFDFDADLNLDLATVQNFYPLDGTELRGQMTAKANAVGELAKTEEARFNADIKLENGYVKMADMEEAIRNINVDLSSTQDLATIRSFSADAAGNTLRLSGAVTQPLDETRTRFDLRGNLNLDLATVPKFYPISTDTLDMRGKLTFDGTARGLYSDPENAAINGTLNLENGYLRYHELPKALEDITFQSSITSEKMTISRAAMKTGSNQFSTTGDITGYMGDNPVVSLLINGTFNLSEVHDFFDLQPYISSLSGSANSDLRVSGQVNDPEKLRFNGSLQVRDVQIAGDSLPQPIRDLRGNLVFSNEDLNLRELTLKMGESDFDITGTLSNYMRLVAENPSGLAELRATYKSNKLNVDEIYQWEPTPEDAEPEAFPIHLPKMQTDLTAEIKELIFFGVNVTDIKGRMQGDDKYILISGAEGLMFGGSMTGNMRWDVPRPDRTKMTFNGNMQNVRVEDLLKEFNPAGLKDVNEHLSGGFSGTINYVTEMDVYLDPILETTVSEGNFQLMRGTLRDHPTQIRAAELLRSPELRNLSLDNMNSSFNIKDGVMTLRNFNLTSRETGLELNGTQHIINGRINYNATVVLPGSLGKNLEPVLTKEGVEALKRSDGKITVPILVTGTTENPNVGLNRDAIQARITEYLRSLGSDAADDLRNRLRNLFGN